MRRKLVFAGAERLFAPERAGGEAEEPGIGDHPRFGEAPGDAFAAQALRDDDGAGGGKRSRRGEPDPRDRGGERDAEQKEREQCEGGANGPNGHRRPRQ